MEANRLASHTVEFFNFVAVCSIVIYQKVISPVKGFSCAHRYRHGGLSCSEYVKQVVLRKGIVSGYTDIRSRFHACKSATLEFHGKSPRNEAGVLDCGLDSCGDFGDIGSCFDGSGSEGGSGRSPVVIVLPIGLLILLLIFAGSAWFTGPRVSAIDIRLIEGQQEAQEKGVARILGGKHPDYQVVFVVNGKKVATNTLNNSTARSWLRLKPRTEFKISDLEQITILNKQVLEDKVLEIIDKPERQGSGEYYEYRLSEDQDF